MKHIIFVTEISTIMGYDRFKNISDVFIRLLDKYYPDLYQKLLTDNNKSRECTNDEIINNLSKTGNMNITIPNMTTANDIADYTTKFTSSVQSNETLQDHDKKILVAAIKKKVHCDFGIFNEKSVLDEYCALYKKKTIDSSAFIFTKLVSNWSVGGKLDGLTDDNIIIEIKNRAGGQLFNTVRDYENTQIQAYMHIMKMNLTHLVEAVKTDLGYKIGVIEAKYDDIEWHKIENKLLKFIRVFENTLKDPKFLSIFIRASPGRRNYFITERME